jgi:thioredoxin reductase
MSLSEYDLVVIGSGPAGQKGAIAAAKARKRRHYRPDGHDRRRECSYWHNPQQDDTGG